MDDRTAAAAVRGWDVLRRLELAGEVDPTAATLAHVDLLDLAVWLVGYPALADRARERRVVEPGAVLGQRLGRWR